MLTRIFSKPKQIFKIILAAACIFGMLAIVQTGFADVTISGIATTLQTSVGSIGKILVDVSLISGIGFILVAFFKFHAHKNNPQQVPLSQGISLLVIGAGLTVFPYLITGVGGAAFGQTKTATSGGGQLTSLLASGKVS
ncbi:MAG: DUF6750 family protein [Candidatus Thioglobus sp.]